MALRNNKRRRTSGNSSTLRHQHDDEKDYYYERGPRDYYDDYDVNHPEERRDHKYLFDDDYEFNDYGISPVHIDTYRDHSSRLRSTDYNENEVPHTSAMAARYSPRYQRRYNRLENPRSAKDLTTDEYYAEGAGYSDWDTIASYGIAGKRHHEILDRKEKYNAPYNYGYENTVSSRKVNYEDQLHNRGNLPVKRRELYPDLYTKSGKRKNVFPYETQEPENTGTRRKRRSLTTAKSRTAGSSRKGNANFVYDDNDEQFLSRHEMYMRRRPMRDRTGVFENYSGSGFSRYGNYSDGRYAMDDYDAVFDEDTTGRHESSRSYGKAGRRNMRERG